MSATTYPPVHVESVDFDLTQLGRDELREGLIGAKSEIGEPPQIAALHEDHPAVDAWYAITREAAESIMPDVERLLEQAIRARLPWTWEPDR